MNNKEWFKNARFGLMIHFGLYSLLGGEWKGKRLDYIGEWIQSCYKIPKEEYEKLQKAFNPILFDAEEWVKLAKDAGMQYMVVTSKHHDGFCLFDSAWDDFNVVKGTPFGRDMIAELAEACYKHGMKLGLYYSQELDWHEPDCGGVSCEWDKKGDFRCTNEWIYPDASKKDYNRLFNGKIKAQFREILTKYGDLALVWCDTPMDITPEQSRELFDLIKHYQPDCLVNTRIGNNLGDYFSCEDNDLDFVPEKDGLYECPATLNDTWGYKTFDNNWKSAETVRTTRDRLNAKGINYLLNIGPDPLGRFPVPAMNVLKELSK